MSTGHEHIEHRLPPSGEGTVVLDIGEGVGALVVHASRALDGVEIELARRGETSPLVHTEVRERRLPSASAFAGVFPALDEGEYTLLGTDAYGARDVVVRSGRVTEVAVT